MLSKQDQLKANDLIRISDIINLRGVALILANELNISLIEAERVLINYTKTHISTGRIQQAKPSKPRTRCNTTKNYLPYTNYQTRSISNRIFCNTRNLLYSAIYYFNYYLHI